MTETTLLIIVILSSLCVSAASIYLVMIFYRMEKSLDHLDKKVSALCEQTFPILENLNAITTKVRTITDNLNEQLSIVKDSVESFRIAMDEIIAFKRKVQHRIEEPVMDSVSFVTAFVKGIKAFFERMRS
ncbi:MAG: DUF948 domain-containing protein [Ignavibacteria bacterium]|nr:DUF948 domain-containing protein [Ignavibacteria bacterium]